jgi:integrase
MSSIFRYEIRRGRCERNPVLEADLPRPSQRVEIRYLTIPELEALLAAAPADALGLMERALYATAAMTGLRRGELLALRWGDVDFAAGVVRVRRSYRKGRFDAPKTRSSARAVPLGARVRRELEQHLARTPFSAVDDLVFGLPSTGSVYDGSYMTKRFRATRRRAGLRPMRFHDLRHTFGTQMAAAGAPLRSIQAWLGHTDYKTTLIYADYVPDITGAAAFAARAFGEAAPTNAEDTRAA